MNGHERIEELIAARALGGLDAEDERALDRERAEHGPDCAECRRLEIESAEAAGRIAFALSPTRLRPGAEDELLSRAREERRGSDGAVSLDDRRDARATRTSEKPTRPRNGWRAAIAVAAAVVLFVGGWVVGAAVTGGSGVDLRAAGTEIVTFDSEAGQLAVAFEPGEPGVLILGSDLPSPGEGNVYEVWMLDGDEVTQGPCVTPEADGSLAEFVDAELGTTDTMAITIEPASCPSAPTSDPIATAQLV